MVYFGISKYNSPKIWKFFDIIWIILAPISTFVFIFSFILEEKKDISRDAFSSLDDALHFLIYPIERHRDYLECEKENVDCAYVDEFISSILNKGKKLQKLNYSSLVDEYEKLHEEKQEICEAPQINYKLSIDSINEGPACHFRPNKNQMLSEMELYIDVYNKKVDEIISKLENDVILTEQEAEEQENLIDEIRFWGAIVILFAFPLRLSKSFGEFITELKKK